MEIALNSDTPGGFKHENAIASQNGLALLASITLKNALNINNNNNNINDSSTKKNLTKNNNNNKHLNQNKSKKTHHEAPQLQYGFISSPTIASSSSLSSSAVTGNISLSSSLSASSATNASVMQHVNITEQKNVFTFTTAGLQALTATAISTSENENRGGLAPVDQQHGQLNAASSSNNSSNKNNHKMSLSSNHHHTNHSSNNTPNEKDPTVALLEALSIKTKKKLPSVSTQQQQTSASSSAIAMPHVGTNGNNNTNNNSNNGSGGNGNSNKNSYRIPSDILDDLASRFIINVPDMELSNLIRICFQIELAHWFYLDFFCASEEETKLQPCGIKQFALQIFEHIPFLRQHLSSIDKILEDWKNYKLSVPTYGAILISEDLNFCLLVQSYFAKSSWGFPKGKINENEDPVHCAAREVYEETGYDITEFIVPNDYIEAVINYQYTRLYIVRDVSLDTKFSPRTRNEIKCCDWFPIDSLPVNKNDAISRPKLGRNANSFFMIMPFVKRLKKWVNDKRNGVETQHRYSNGGSPTSTSPLTTAIKNGQQIKQNSKKQQKRNNSNNFNDEINALNNAGSGATTAALATNSCGNNASVNCSNSNSNRSKRQRHKSMGDLDITKLNNFNNCNNNQSNCKSTNNHNNNNNNNNNCGSIISSGTTTLNGGGNISCHNVNTNNSSNQKRNSKIVAAGCNVSNTNNGCTSNSNNNHSSSCNSSSKRQLFHSQSQTNNLQQNGEKIVSSFDLIRKEKQMKASAVKTQKQQQNLNNNNGRQRAKSQSDKMSQQQQQQKSLGNSGNNKQQQRLQKQQSLIAANNNVQNYNISNGNHQNNNNSNKNHTNNNHTKSDVNDSFNSKMTIGAFKTPTPPPINGNDLLALAVAAAAAPSVAHTTKTSSQVSKKSICDQQQPQQKTRPSSVSLHFTEVSPFKCESVSAGNQMPQLTRMASGTNLRILKRSTSHQSSQSQQPQPPQRQASALQFTPSFNSWTNFTFTKNFIANVFC